MSTPEQKFNKFLLNIQLFKTIIMTYNYDKDKEKFFENLKTLESDFITVDAAKSDVYANKNQDMLRPIIDLECFYPIVDKHIIYEKKFLEHAHTIFEKIIYNIAFLIKNIGAYIERLQKSLNKIFIENYFLLDCSNIKDMNTPFLEGEKVSYYDYNCGRGFMRIEEGSSRFLIFNTNNDAMLDINIVNKYNKTGVIFSEKIFNVKYPVDSNLLKSDEYKNFKKELKEMKEIDTEYDNMFLNFSKKTGYNVIYKIPFNLNYFSIGEFSKGENFFSLGMFVEGESIVAKYDLIIEGQEIKRLLFPDVLKILKQKGFIN
jgi:hypothetical protein